MWTSRHLTFSEWMDIPFVLTRVFVTLLGGFFLVLALANLWVLNSKGWAGFFPAEESAPKRLAQTTGPEENDEVVRTSCFVEVEPPVVTYLLPAVLGILPVWAMLVVWRRPRAGFRLAAVGLAILDAAGLWMGILHLGVDGVRNNMDERGVAAVSLVLLWLWFASWKVGAVRTPSAVPPGP